MLIVACCAIFLAVKGCFSHNCLCCEAVDEFRSMESVLHGESFEELVTGALVRREASSKHRWLYFPLMQGCETLLLKCFDSDLSASARFSVHASVPELELSRCDPARPRQSIEVRTIAFFPSDELAKPVKLSPQT